MDLSILLLLGLGLALAVPFLGGDDDDDEANRIDGSPEGEPINGTEGADSIFALAGDDVINAGGGNDFVNAGLGNDTVNGGDGRDVIQGRAGNDIINGDNGNDRIEGGAGDDTIDGGYGSDTILGGRGTDVIKSGFNARLIDNELVNATETLDIIRGQGGEDTLFMWGDDSDNSTPDNPKGLSLAVGGVNSAPPGEVGPPELDELILVTGESDLQDDEGPTNFFVFANLEDDQDTLATIVEFNPAQHKLVLTIDADLDGATAPAVDFVLTETSLDGEDGVLVEARFEDAMGDPTDPDFDYEVSRAFLRGATIASLDESDFAVVLTDNDIPEPGPDDVLTEADFTLFNPEATLETVKNALPGFLNTSPPA